MINTLPLHSPDDTFNETLFAGIARDLEKRGYSIRPLALPEQLAAELYMHQASVSDDKFIDAGIGRGDNFLKNEFVRSDEICWINGDSQAGQNWLAWMTEMRHFLNSRLFLGLFSFESHFAHYRPGDFYKRHYDAFRGETNRILSVVAYLNPGWTNIDGGELVIYRNERDSEGIQVVPLLGTLVVFLSEEFPHEVLPTHRDRYSVAGWFRVNTSVMDKVDPPR